MGSEAKRASLTLGTETYIIIKKIEINICCKLIGENLQLTFDGLRFSKHFVTVPLGGCLLREPLAYIRTHLYSPPKSSAFSLLLASRLASFSAALFYSSVRPEAASALFFCGFFDGG